MNLTLACCWTEDAYPLVYVLRLREMVRAAITNQSYEFVVLTDKPETIHRAGLRAIETEPDHGFWVKAHLFAPNIFRDSRILYLDLDVVILRNLRPLFSRPGIINDWNVPGFNSSVMCWDARTMHHIWRAYQKDPEGWRRRVHGDQDLISRVAPGWPIYPESWCISYKAHRAKHGSEMPKDAIVVCLHGKPKNLDAQIESPWIFSAWAEASLPLRHLDRRPG